jgi:class 3 adenylate cyclase
LFKLYSTQGNIHFQDEKYEKALSAYKKAYDVTVELNDQKNIQNASFNMSISQLMLGEVDSATALLNLSLYAAKVGTDSSSIGKIYNVLAGVHTDFDKRVAYMDSAITIAKNLNDFVDLHAYYQNLALAYSEEKDYYWAFEYSWISSNYKDSVYKEETANSIAEMMERYESEQKSLEIANLELKNNEALLEAELLKSNQYKLILGSVGLVILLIISLIVIKQTRDHRKMLALKNEAIEIEKERSEELLLNILPYEVAEELKEKGESEAKDFENVTVLFSDFQHFTETAEKLSAKELVKEINSCFKGFDEIMNKYGVEKIKTIGDAYMAAGGLHIPRTTEPIDVVKAGLEMQSFMQARKEQKKKAGEPFFEMRIGIHTGPVVAGIVGVKKFQYDIWGDTVNTAARMESSSEVQKVNISDFTYQILKENPEFQFEDRGEIEVKGKGKIRMWFVALA